MFDLWHYARCIGVFDCINVLFIAPLPFSRLPCDLQFQGRARGTSKYLLQGSHCRQILLRLITVAKRDQSTEC